MNRQGPRRLVVLHLISAQPNVATIHPTGHSFEYIIYISIHMYIIRLFHWCHDNNFNLDSDVNPQAKLRGCSENMTPLQHRAFVGDGWEFICKVEKMGRSSINGVQLNQEWLEGSGKFLSKTRMDFFHLREWNLLQNLSIVLCWLTTAFKEQTLTNPQPFFLGYGIESFVAYRWSYGFCRPGIGLVEITLEVFVLRL